MSDLTRRGKKLSWLLRHGAGEAGLAMDAAGWAAVDDVLRETGLSRDELEAVVSGNDKARYQLEGGRIRASQGHSLAGMPIEREALEASWSVHDGRGSAWHGTNLVAAGEIAEAGVIHAGERSHVHLAASLESRVGKRANVAVGLEISLPRLREHGLQVYVSPNGVVLVREVPVACVVGIEPLTKRVRASLPELLRAFGLERSA